MKKIKLLLVDDHEIVRKGFSFLLSGENDIEIIGEANNGQEAIEFLNKHTPDIIISDITMPVMNGVELLKELKKKKSSAKTIILTMHLDYEYIVEAIDLGAKGYVLKDAPEKDFIQSIYSVYEGKTYLSSAVSGLIAQGYMLGKIKQENTELHEPLTKREKEVLALIVEGKSNRLIAESLFISVKTVSAHRYNLMQKLNVSNTAGLVKLAIEENLY